MPWNVAVAVKSLQDNAQPTSIGACAKYTRMAIEAGGVTLTRHNSAKDYGPSLRTVGFAEFDRCPDMWKKGDVVIMAGFTGHPHGHMQMYDGAKWISDFKQSGFWPGKDYRETEPPYAMYRYPLVPGMDQPVPMPAGAKKPYPGTSIRRGQTGPNVRTVQTRLVELGQRISIDGDFGQYTESAVITFQRSKHLTADGIVGPNTWSALFG